MQRIMPIETEWIELSESDYNRLDSVLKPYFYKAVQYKDGCLPEWKNTIVPGYHVDEGHEMREVYKLVLPIKSTTGSEFGSIHWFNTLISRHLHMGEFLKEKSPTEEVLRSWGDDLYKTTQAIIAWKKMIDKGWITPTNL